MSQPLIAVRSTGIVCRPGCPSPTPRAANVERFEIATDALFAGYRPCLRCGPEIEDSPRGRRALRRVALLRELRRPRRRRAEEGVIRLALLSSALGSMVAGVVLGGIALLEFADRPMLETQMQIVSKRLRSRAEPGRTPLHDALQQQLDAYFAGEIADVSVPIVAPGTPFQEQVWRALRAIPAGETRSYADVAAVLGRPAAVRAVGAANGMNRIALLVPCHRVVASDGRLAGYGGGVWRKARLLELERSRARQASAPAASSGRTSDVMSAQGPRTGTAATIGSWVDQPRSEPSLAG